MSSTANSSQSVEMTHALAPSSAFSDETAYSMFEKGSHILGRNGVVSVDGRVTFLRPLMVVEFCANSGSSGVGVSSLY